MPLSLSDLLDQTALAPKALIVQSPQAGRKLLSNWARRGIPTIGLRAYTPGSLADAVLQEAFPDQIVPRLPDFNQVLGLDEILRQFDFRRLEALGWSGEQLADSIRQMRIAAVSPEEYRKQRSGKLSREVAEVYRAYEKWLYESQATDEFERLGRAEFALGKVRLPELLVVMGDTPLSEAARAFLEAVAGRVDRHAVLDADPEAPAATAARVLGDWPRAAVDAEGSPVLDLVRVAAVEEEARFVFDEVERRELPVDSVEVAYPRHTPYLPMLLGEASRRRIAVTSAAGTPLSDLPVGQGVRLFLEWLAGGEDSTDLVRLLRSGFVRLADSVSSRNVIANLVEVHVAGGRRAYRRAFQGLRKAAQAELDQAAGTERERGAKLRVKRIRDAERAVDRLFDFVPTPDDTLRGFAQRLRKFVETFLPEVPDTQSLAAKGRADLLARLVQIEEGPDSAHPALHLIGRFRDWLPTVILRARLDQPGALHVVPLDSAGLAGRQHLFVVGLDSGNFLPSPVEDVFLPDEFCEAYARISGPLTSEERVERRRYALRRAIARTPGTATVVVAEGRVSDDAAAGPASTFIELEEAQGRARPGLVPQGRDVVRAVLRHRSSPAGQQILRTHFPALARGMDADAARASLVFSDFDGFVGEQATVKALLDTPMSASRLQVLAACPFQFFQSQVLGVPNLEERRRGEWMTPLENGKLVHDALNEFNDEIMAGQAGARDTERLRQLLHGAFKAFRKGNEPPSEFAWRAKLRELDRIAQVVTSIDREVVTAELGFGMSPWRAQSEADHTGDFLLPLGGTSILLRGRIDVVERTDRGLVITDYKTGRSDDFDERDLLDAGKRLQWVLYAYAYEELRGERVDESGYLFVSGDTAGQTAYDRPPTREEIGELLEAQLGLARRGAFGASVEPGGHCKWCDYRRVCGDLYDRRTQIQDKLNEAADAGPATDPGGDGHWADPVGMLMGWTYGERHVERRKK